MQLSAAQLLQYLELLDMAIPKKSKQGMGHLNFALFKDGRAQATNLELSIDIAVPECANETLMIPVDEVLAYLRNVPGYDLCRVEQHAHLEIVRDGTKAKFSAEKSDSFPTITGIKNGGLQAAVDGDAFLRGLNSVYLMAAHDDKRPILNGVCVDFGEETTFVAVDGFRLGMMKTAIKTDKLQVVIPAYIPGILTTLWRKSSKPVAFQTDMGLAQLAVARRLLQVHVNADKFSLAFGDVVLTGNAIAGNYPKYSQLIPKDFPTTVTFDAETLVQTLRQAKMVDTGIARMWFEEDELKIKVANEGRQLETVIPAKVTGPAGRFGCSIAYVVEYLSKRNGQVTVKFGEFTHPSLWHVDTVGAPECLIMPMYIERDKEFEKPKDQKEAAPAAAEPTKQQGPKPVPAEAKKPAPKEKKKPAKKVG